MSLANKTFKNNITGEEVTVINSFENIAILENKQKIDVSTLMDTNQYTEKSGIINESDQIDPNLFFNNQGSYNSLADKIKNITTSDMVDEEGVVSVNVDNNGLQPTTEESAIVMTTEEDERAELMKKYGAVGDTSNGVSKQNEAFSKILDEDDLPQVTTTQPKTTLEVDNVHNVQRVEVSRDNPPVQRVVVDDPIITMFKGVKRSVNFNIDIPISDKIPRLDFIEMMEDSYEISLIDFLAEEFTNNILENPDIIKEAITDKIKLLVYGAPIKTIEEKQLAKTKEGVITSSKLSAPQRSKAISKLNTVEAVKKALIGEKAKSVKEAGSKRIEELEKNN